MGIGIWSYSHEWASDEIIHKYANLVHMDKLKSIFLHEDHKEDNLWSVLIKIACESIQAYRTRNKELYSYGNSNWKKKNHVNHVLSHFTVHEPNEQINQSPITFHNNVSIGCNIFRTIHGRKIIYKFINAAILLSI
jgi:hypothetical protein